VSAITRPSHVTSPTETSIEPFFGGRSRSPSNPAWLNHTFRHTFASIHLSQGTNLLQLSRALGHHSAAFTLSRYTHLLPGDEAPALDLSDTKLQSSGRLGPVRVLQARIP